jgi:outer membrane protein TolC
MKAVKIALGQNPTCSKQLQEIQRTRGQYIEVRAEALPHLTLSRKYDQRAKELFDTGSTIQAAFSPHE